MCEREGGQRKTEERCVHAARVEGCVSCAAQKMSAQSSPVIKVQFVISNCGIIDFCCYVLIFANYY